MVVWSAGVARSPSLAVRPATQTRPGSIQDSISRREPWPAAARSFCSRSPRGLAVGSGGGLFRLGIGGSLPGVGYRRTLELKGPGDFLERRQLLQRAQPEIVEKLAGGGVKRRPARRLALAHGVDPAAVLQRLDDLAGNRHAADVLDVAAGHRLAVSDDGEGFHDGAGVARWLFGEQALEVRPEFGAGLEPPAAGQADQLDPAAVPFLAQLGEQVRERLGAHLVVEQPLELRYAEWLLRREQHRSEERRVGKERRSRW